MTVIRPVARLQILGGGGRIPCWPAWVFTPKMTRCSESGAGGQWRGSERPPEQQVLIVEITMLYQKKCLQELSQEPPKIRVTVVLKGNWLDVLGPTRPSEASCSIIGIILWYKIYYLCQLLQLILLPLLLINHWLQSGGWRNNFVSLWWSGSYINWRRKKMMSHTVFRLYKNY